MTINIKDFGFYRIAVAAPELKPADVNFNVSKIKELALKAIDEDCSFVLFPELSITGYTCADLFFQRQLLDASIKAIKDLAEFTALNNCSIIVGAPIVSDDKLFNCAVFISWGNVCGIVPKTFLPNTNEYYERRWFASEYDRTSDTVDMNEISVPFGTDIIFQASDFADFSFAIEICEDLWAVVPPASLAALEGAKVIFNLSASDEYLSKSEYRRNLVLNQSARCNCVYAYASAGPGESSTDVVFSGHCIIAENGSLQAETKRFSFESQIAYADIDLEKLQSERLRNTSFRSAKSDRIFRIVEFLAQPIPTAKLNRYFAKNPFVPEDKHKRDENCEEIFAIQTTGLAKRLKHIGAKKVVIGLSGGLDSTLAFLVCLKTFEKLGLDKSGIVAVTMPGFGTTVRTKSNAQNLAELCGVELREISIDNSVLAHFADINHDVNVTDVVYENAQARMRTLILMDLANKLGGIVIGTGDLSEIALGWSTYNGDHMSMYAVNCGAPKTLIKHIVDWSANSEFDGEIRRILLDIVDTPISPELLPADQAGEIAQKTEESVGPYILNDFFLYHFIRFGYSPEKLQFIAEQSFKDEYDPDFIKTYLNRFIQRFFTNQYKRSCIPDGPKVGSVALSPRGDWRMPSDASYASWIK